MIPVDIRIACFLDEECRAAARMPGRREDDGTLVRAENEAMSMARLNVAASFAPGHAWRRCAAR
jgi:hypothetical protein